MLARSARWPIAETTGLSGIAIRGSGTERLGNSGNSGSTWAGVSGAIVLSPGATGSGNSGTVLVGGDAGSLGAGGELEPPRAAAARQLAVRCRRRRGYPGRRVSAASVVGSTTRASWAFGGGGYIVGGATTIGGG